MSFIRDRLQEIDYQEYLAEQEYLMEKEAFLGIGKGVRLAWNAGRNLFQRGRNFVGKVRTPTLQTADEVASKGMWRNLASKNARNPDGSYVYNWSAGTSKPMVQKKTSIWGSFKDTMQGGTPTRRDQLMQKGLSRELDRINALRRNAGKDAFGSADEMLNSMSLRARGRLQNRVTKEIAPKLQMSKWDFLKNHPGEALPWYAKQMTYKGLTYGVPAYDMYDAIKDPNRGFAEGAGSVAGSTLGFLIPGKARGAMGVAAQIGGSMAGSMIGGGLAKSVTGGGLRHTAEGAMTGKYRVPPPQAMPPPMTPNQMTPAQPPPPYYG